MTTTTVTVQNIAAARISVSDITAGAFPFVAINIGDVSLFVSPDETVVLDALREATTRAYELLAETANA